MVVISQALETAIAVILFVVLVIIFFQVFGAAECDTFANTTAIEITDAINKVSLEDGVQQWTADRIPSDEDTGYYVPVPIRLCQRNPLDVFFAQFSAQMPEYILTYETFPEPGIAWSESQPFSGGAAESVLNYAVFKYGFKAAIWTTSFGTKLVTKLVTKAGSTIKALVLKSGIQVLRDRLTRYWDSFVNNRYIKGVLSKLKLSKKLSSAADKVDDIINLKYYSKKGQDLISKVRDKYKDGKIAFERALVDAGFFEEGVNGLAKRNIEGKLIVSEKYKDVAYELIENSKDTDFKTSLYIPPKYPWLSAIPGRIQKYVEPLKNAVTNSRVYKTAKTYLYEYPKKLYDKITGAYENAKDKFNRVFNYNEGMIEPDLVLVEAGVLKKVSLRKITNTQSLEELRKGIDSAKNKDDIMDAIRKITGETINSVDDINTKTISNLASNYQLFQSTQDLTKFIPREQIELTGIASEKIGKEIKEELEKIKVASDPLTAYNNFKTIYSKDWAGLTPAEKDVWIKKFSKGYVSNGVPFEIEDKKAMEVYNKARASLISEGLLDSSKVAPGGNVRASLISKKAGKVNADMIENKYLLDFKYQGSTDVINEFIVPIVAEDNLDKITERKALSYGWERVKRGVMLDMNRIGLNPLNVIPSPYQVKEALETETEIKEGGCAAHSICKIQRGLASGPTESTSVYMLDEKVPESVEVKLWRPNPDDRIPAGLNTILFSTSVTENPRFYLAGPCFGIAKVWKNGNTVYVTVDKNRKCDVGGCDQAAVTLNLTASPISIPFIDLLPFVDEVKTPGAGLGVITIGMEDIDTPNYCYADEGLIWGQSDGPSQLGYYALYGTCTAFCNAAATAATAGLSLAAVRQCLKACEYPVVGVLMADVFLETQAYRDVSSWERQDTGWGYWNYQKAADICDNIDLIASIFGSTPKSGGIIENQFFKTSIGSKVWVAGSKINKFAGIGVDELCYGIQVMGDTSLSWPIKTPAGEIWRKATVLTESCMKESADKCVWIEKCDGPGDCPTGMTCEDGVCK